MEGVTDVVAVDGVLVDAEALPLVGAGVVHLVEVDEALAHVQQVVPRDAVAREHLPHLLADRLDGRPKT